MIPSKLDLEGRVQSIVAQLVRDELSEDGSVEFKREWPPVDKVHTWARRIAALANASRGHPALWIVGVDEKARTVVGVNAADRATLIPKIATCFESGFIPSILHDLTVPIGEKSVVALLFETDRAPYLVCNPAGGAIQYEIPWRDATGTRSAKREDVVGLLYGRKRAARVEVLQATVTATPHPKSPNLAQLEVFVKAYISPHPGVHHIWPNHLRGVLLVRGRRPGPIDAFGVHQGELSVWDGRVRYTPLMPNGAYYQEPEPQNPPLRTTEHEAVLSAPTCAYLNATLAASREHLPESESLFIRCALIDAHDGEPTVVEAAVDPCEFGENETRLAVWNFEKEHAACSFRPNNAVARALLVEPELRMFHQESNYAP